MNDNVCQICHLPGHWTRNCPGIPLRTQDREPEPEKTLHSLLRAIDRAEGR